MMPKHKNLSKKASSKFFSSSVMIDYYKKRFGVSLNLLVNCFVVLHFSKKQVGKMFRFLSPMIASFRIGSLHFQKDFGSKIISIWDTILKEMNITKLFCKLRKHLRLRGSLYSLIVLSLSSVKFRFMRRTVCIFMFSLFFLIASAPLSPLFSIMVNIPHPFFSVFSIYSIFVFSSPLSLFNVQMFPVFPLPSFP